MPQIYVRVTGGAIRTALVLLMLALSGLALVWLLVGPELAIGLGFGLIALVRGLVALFKPGD
ncbi:hypothetical protein [Saccharopolyspora pogona]|uniref:hypothetical protein n=1 Tax=Saccharopolyspora pogona TaxID=333966 RepID=UPI00168415FC|nr:hypothetical protein [Saccharopolyspora pogona]